MAGLFLFLAFPLGLLGFDLGAPTRRHFGISDSHHKPS